MGGLPLRLMVGCGFIEHGFAKWSHGPAHFASILFAMGIPAPEIMAWITILTELIGGAAVLVGAFIPLASIPMAAVLMVAMFTVHLPYGFSSIELQSVTSAGAQFGPPGYEVDLLYLALPRGTGCWRSGANGVDQLPYEEMTFNPQEVRSSA